MTRPGLSVLWRGPLSGCNYDCGYCPFAKRKDSRQTLARDRAALERFAQWALERDGPTSVLFTPWGEALVRRHYRDAITRLSHGARIERVAIQTNLSAPLGWLADCDRGRVGIWATWHPGQVTRDRFLDRIEALETMGVSYSVGVVGLRDNIAEIESLRAQMPRDAYLWINAEESVQGCYAPDEVERLAAIDPLFELNDRPYASKGRACAAGHTMISVNGEGEARPCHFVDTLLGNIYDPGFEARLEPTLCPRSSCNCHIGYSHLEALGLPALFGEGFLERRAHRPKRADARRAIAAFETQAR